MVPLASFCSVFLISRSGFSFCIHGFGIYASLFHFQIVKKCNHFEWMDEYVERLQREGLIDFKGAPTLELNLPPSVKNMRNAELEGAPTVGDVDLNGELKKMNKNLKQMIQVMQQANMIALGFYFCIVALGFVYLVVNPR